jgi:hypothetical protein
MNAARVQSAAFIKIKSSNIMDGIREQTDRPAKREREKILVLLYSDGFVEVYGEKHIDARIVNVPVASTPAGEILAEEYVELTIPRCYRDIYFPTAKRATELLRPIKPSDIAFRKWSVELVRQIQGRNA